MTTNLNQKTSGPMLRTIEHVHWQGKNYMMPYPGLDLKTDEGKMITLHNRFGGDSISVPWFAAAVYDVIMGSERLQQWEDHAIGMDWFAENFSDAYMVLLD